MRYSFLALILSTLLVHAQAPAPSASTEVAAPKPGEPGPPQIQVELRCVTLPQNLALPLIRKFRTNKAAPQAEATGELDDLIAKGTATIQGWLLTTCLAGQKARAEDSEELRYASEYEPHVISNVPPESERDEAATLQNSILQTETSLSPSSFDSRLLGVILEVEPRTAADAGLINLAFVASRVRLKAMDRIVSELDRTSEKKSEKAIVETPRFTTFKAEGNLSLKSGEQKLAGIFRGPDGEKSIELFIITADWVER